MTFSCSFYDVEGGFNPNDFVPPDFCWYWIESLLIQIYFLFEN